MKTTSLTIVTLVVAAIAGTAVAPAMAKDWRPDGSQKERTFRDGDSGGAFVVPRGDRGGLGDGVLSLVCSERGADQLEHMLLTIQQRTDVTAEQETLYDAFRDAATKAQADFIAACVEARPAEGAVADLDLAQRLRIRIEIESAHIEAMSAVLPAFEAFYASLTPEQKAGLEPPFEPRLSRQFDDFVDAPRAPLSRGPYGS